jgi:hypothetical protein
MSAGISRDEWLKALGETIERPDPNAMTTMEFAAMLGIGRTAARAKLTKLVAAGKARPTTKIIRSGAASTRCSAYALVKGKLR